MELGNKLVLLFLLPLAPAMRGKLDAGEWAANAPGIVWRATSAIPIVAVFSTQRVTASKASTAMLAHDKASSTGMEIQTSKPKESGKNWTNPTGIAPDFIGSGHRIGKGGNLGKSVKGRYKWGSRDEPVPDAELEGVRAAVGAGAAGDGLYLYAGVRPAQTAAPLMVAGDGGVSPPVYTDAESVYSVL
ncbi:hypothetical protein GUJ93_ZPchr0008g11512 [Zizania palustris]|uniref:Uncharacterized protein n=1 Tax=Zizania palustris TaxID=103762 RepID=A0A8J5VFU5_ZIZPA|nr:hypothetical protein GUJ93_ZPchr0008g11512 [Zizania palustris]